jgi:parallel beta-helix repeat protein
VNFKTLLTLVLLVAAFAGGMFYAKSSTPTVMTNSVDTSYTGGYDKDNDLELANIASQSSPAGSIGDVMVIVKEGESIQEAVKAAVTGTTIQIMPGTYSETVYIDKDSIRLIGVIQEGRRATLDGNKTLNDAILFSGNNIVVENLLIKGYKGNGIMSQAGNNFEIRNNIIADTGVYGIFPQLGKNGVIEHNVVSGIEDAAIYVGMSDNIHVAHNEVFDSVAGIEIENSRHAIVENNYVHNNTGGILAFITPGLPIKTTFDVIIRHNFVIGNNHENFGAPGSTVAGIPAGTGMLIMAADDVIIEDNIISDNKTAGILIVDHANSSNVTMDPGAEPNPDRVAILDNTMIRNGYNTIADVKTLMLLELKSVEPDIVHVSNGKDSCIANRQRYKTVGVKNFNDCTFSNTDDIETYLLDTPVPPRDIKPSERGMIAYLGVCTGCHAYNGRLIGPPIQTIQALYMDNPQGLADYIANPIKKREDYPEMPAQSYLGDETLLAVAKYVLSREN